MSKILMVLDHEFPHDVRVEKEINSLLNKGYEVHIACFTFENRPLLEKWKNIVIHRKRISSFLHKTHVGCLKFPFYFNFWRFFLNKIFEQNSFDLIHIHDLPLAQVGFEISKKYNIPWFLDLHENWPEYTKEARHLQSVLGKLLSSYKQWLEYEKKFVSLANGVITVAEEMAQRLNILPNTYSCAVVPNYLDIDSFVIENKNEFKKFTLIYIGGVSNDRGVDTVIKAMPLIVAEYPDVTFEIYGPCHKDYLFYLKSLIKKLPKHVSKNIIIHGPVSQDKVSEYIQKAHILLLPHKKSIQTDNSSPNKLFQYMAAGRPIICSNCNSLIPLVEENDCGKIFIHDNFSDLASKVIDVFREDDFEKYKINGPKSITEKYNWLVSQKELLRLYNNFLVGN